MQALLNGLAVATVSFVIFTPAQVVADLVFRANTYTVTKNHALFSHSFNELPTTSRLRCARLCLNSDTCRSFNHDDTNGGKCQVNGVQKGDFPADFRPDEGFSYYEPVGEGTVPNEVPTTCTPKTTPGPTPDPTPSSTPGPILGSTSSPEAERTTLAPTPVLTTVREVIGSAPVFSRCPDSSGSFTYNGTTTAVVTRYPSPSFKDAEDGGLYEGDFVCKDTVTGADSPRVKSYPIGTDKRTRCTAHDSDGNPAVCEYGFVVVDCPCCRALGMESGEILDEQITVTSVLNGDDALYGLHLARLNSVGGWCAEQSGLKWIQVDYNRTVDTYGIIAQHHGVINAYATLIDISYSDDGISWTYMKTDTGQTRTLPVWGHDSLVPLQTPTKTFIRSRFIRIHIAGIHNEFCLRFELIGCST